MDESEKRAKLDPESVCLSCRAGLHNECELGFTNTLEPDQECCCRGEFHYGLYKDLDARFEKILKEAEADVTVGVYMGATPPVNTGYLRPEACPGLTKDIDTLLDALSTGRKMADRIQEGLEGKHLVCEWAELRFAGGGPEPIVGCLGNPASALHHGPDKNTLNNLRLPGEPDCNLHWICPDCHNRWHARNDKYYDARPTRTVFDEKTGEERVVVDASVPFTPVRGTNHLHNGDVKVPQAELFQIELRRREEAAHGRKQSDPVFGVELDRGQPDFGGDPAGADGGDGGTRPDVVGDAVGPGGDQASDAGSEPRGSDAPRGFLGHIGGGAPPDGDGTADPAAAADD